MQQLIFSFSFFVLSLAFTGYGLWTLDFYDLIGRPGPAYFPTIIGSLLILTTGLNLYKDFEKYRKDDNKLQVPSVTETADDDYLPETDNKHYGKDAAVVACLITLLLILLNPLGSILSMVVFMGLFLFYFNRKGSVLFNISYTILLPLGVYGLFDVLLQAGLPRGLIFGG